MRRWEPKMLGVEKKQDKRQLTNQYIFMSLITGCPKLIPFHYRGRCQTESDAWKKKGARLWISSNYMMLYDDSFRALAGLCCCKTLNWLALVDWECFYLLCWLRGETACSACWKIKCAAGGAARESWMYRNSKSHLRSLNVWFWGPGGKNVHEKQEEDFLCY